MAHIYQFNTPPKFFLSLFTGALSTRDTVSHTVAGWCVYVEIVESAHSMATRRKSGQTKTFELFKFSYLTKSKLNGIMRYVARQKTEMADFGFEHLLTLQG